MIFKYYLTYAGKEDEVTQEEYVEACPQFGVRFPMEFTNGKFSGRVDIVHKE